jgi:hypothetical protein
LAKVAKVVGGTMRRQRGEGGFEHRTPGEGHQKPFVEWDSYVKLAYLRRRRTVQKNIMFKQYKLFNYKNS